MRLETGERLVVLAGFGPRVATRGSDPDAVLGSRYTFLGGRLRFIGPDLGGDSKGVQLRSNTIPFSLGTHLIRPLPAPSEQEVIKESVS